MKEMKLKPSIYKQALIDYAELVVLVYQSNHLTFSEFRELLNGYNEGTGWRDNGDLFDFNYKTLRATILWEPDVPFMLGSDIDVWDDEAEDSHESLTVQDIEKMLVAYK